MKVDRDMLDRNQKLNPVEEAARRMANDAISGKDLTPDLIASLKEDARFFQRQVEQNKETLRTGQDPSGTLLTNADKQDVVNFTNQYTARVKALEDTAKRLETKLKSSGS